MDHSKYISVQTNCFGQNINGCVMDKYFIPFTFCKYDEHIYKLPEGYKSVFVLVN